MIVQFDSKDKSVRIASILLGGLSLLIPFIVFFKTMAPTLSFWDCGEFIASANILGVPHPPGTPFFVVLGRFFIMLGLFKNIAMNTNIISVISSSFTCLVSYLMVVRVSQRLPFASAGAPILRQIGIRIGAFSSALIMAFASTFWFNAVETEVYGLAMLLMMLIIYLAIKWADEKENGGSDKYLVFITYLLFLSISIHLTVFLVVPALVIYFVIIDREKLKDPIFWVTWAILFSVAVPFYFWIGMIIPWVEDKSYWIWLALMILGAAYVAYMAFGRRNAATFANRSSYTLAFSLFAVAILGYSTHLYIPIRAAHHPAINENDPSSFSSFEQYIERKQYGQESMIARMFYRRGRLANQFGRYENMGFGGYFVDQYDGDRWQKYGKDKVFDLFGTLNIFIFAFGIFGILVGAFYAMRKSKLHPMLLLFAIFFLSSVLLLLYLNFSDGTRPDPQNPGELIQLEVRDRDYFYTPAFVIFATIIGVGMSALLALLGDGLRYSGDEKKNNLLRSTVFGVVALGVFLVPLNPFNAHYRSHDRSKDFAPPDYAYNILKSCKPNGILFTNGDNDTFPLWYLQEVERVRKDVRVVNLSLLNTDWYILQLKHQMGVRVFLDDDQIIWIPAARRGSIIYYRPEKKFMDRVRNQWRYLTAEQDPRTGKVMRVQDQMIEQIVIANIDSTPIYFSGSVPTSNRWTLTDRLVRQGIVLEIEPDTSKPRIDIPVYDSLITKVYRYSGLNDINAFKDENNVGLTTTFPERFSELADAYRNIGDTTRAVELLWDSIRRMPYYHQNYIDLYDTFKQMGNNAMVDSVKNAGIKNLKAACDIWPDIILYQQFLGVFYYHVGMKNEAQERYRIAFELQPNNAIAFRLLRDLTMSMGQYDKARAMMVDWINRHPEDLEVQNQLNRMR